MTDEQKQQATSTNNSSDSTRSAEEITNATEGDIKVEIKADPDGVKQTAVNSTQPALALGSNLLPSHATNAKHQVCISHSFIPFNNSYLMNELDWTLFLKLRNDISRAPLTVISFPPVLVNKHNVPCSLLQMCAL
jgi:hypothetical protein